MSLACGLIGLPNVGKSTLFNALTQLNVPALNFPFCTIKPNIGVVFIPDERVKVLSNIIQSKKKKYGYIKYIDIAGLVKGASKGEGLGNQFLSNIRNVNVIVHVVRCFQDTNILHVHNEINPISDIKVINEELILADILMCENLLLSLNNKKVCIQQYDIKIKELLKLCLYYLNNNCMLRTSNFSIEEKNIISTFNFLTFKPVIYILNVDNDKQGEKYYKEISSVFKKDKNNILPVCMQKIKNNNLKKNINNVQKYFLRESDSLQIVNICFNLLNLCTFFTVGKKEVRSWFFLKYSTAIQVAKIIHTDFSIGFIRVKVISYNNFLIYKSENNVRAAGKLYIEGKDYIVQDGDILNFLFNV